MLKPPPVSEAVSLLDEADRLLAASRYGGAGSLNRDRGLELADQLYHITFILASHKATDCWEGLEDLLLAAAQTALVCGSPAEVLERYEHELSRFYYGDHRERLLSHYHSFKSRIRDGGRLPAGSIPQLCLSREFLMLTEDGLCLARRFAMLGDAYAVIRDFDYLLAEVRALWPAYLSRRHPQRWQRCLLRTPACLHILLQYVPKPTPLEQRALIEAAHAVTQARRIQIYHDAYGQQTLLCDWKATLRNSL